MGDNTPPIDHADSLSRLRWARDPQGLDKLIDRLTRRAVALTDEQVGQILAVLDARAKARREPSS